MPKATDSRRTFVWRYMKADHALSILRTKRLFFANPCSWSDKNDVANFSAFARRMNIGRAPTPSVYAACFTLNSERHHFWIKTNEHKVNKKTTLFAREQDMVAIRFDRDLLIASLERATNISILENKVRYVELKTFIKNCKLKKYRTKSLPFLKRHGFKHEGEYRIVVLSEHPQSKHIEVDFSLDSVCEVKIGPYTSPKSVAKYKDNFRRLLPNSGRNVRVIKTHLEENTDWISALDSYR